MKILLFLLTIGLLDVAGKESLGESNYAVDVVVVDADGNQRTVRFHGENPAAFCAAYAAAASAEYCIESLTTLKERHIAGPHWRRSNIVDQDSEVETDSHVRNQDGNLFRYRNVQLAPRLPMFKFVTPETVSDATADPQFYTEDPTERLFLSVVLHTLAGVEKDGIVIDVGMNYGFYTLVAAAMGMHVLSFEVQPQCFDYVRKSIAANGFEDNVRFFHRAVGSASSLSTPSNQCSGTFSVGGQGSSNRGGTIVHVNAATLDESLREIHGRIRLLKIDAEGSELSILTTSSSVLKRVDHLIVEITASAWSEDLPRATDMILEATSGFFGYALLETTSYLNERQGLGAPLEFRRRQQDGPFLHHSSSSAATGIDLSSGDSRDCRPSEVLEIGTSKFDLTNMLSARSATRGARIAPVLDWKRLLSELRKRRSALNVWFISKAIHGSVIRADVCAMQKGYV